MKKLLSLLLLATVPAFAGTFHCTWNLIDFTTTPYNVRQIRIQSIAPYGVHSNAIITGDYFDRQVNSSGSVTVSNLVNGRSYRVTFFGPTVQTVFTNSFDTNVTGLVNGADYISAPITDGNLVGWSRAQADSRFLRTNITQYLRQGTNILFVTNGNSLTIHGTATGASGGTNGDNLGDHLLTQNLDFDGWLATNVFGLRPQVGETIEIIDARIANFPVTTMPQILLDPPHIGPSSNTGPHTLTGNNSAGVKLAGAGIARSIWVQVHLGSDSNLNSNLKDLRLEVFADGGNTTNTAFRTVDISLADLFCNRFRFPTNGNWAIDRDSYGVFTCDRSTNLVYGGYIKTFEWRLPMPFTNWMLARITNAAAGSLWSLGYININSQPASDLSSLGEYANWRCRTATTLTATAGGASNFLFAATGPGMCVGWMQSLFDSNNQGLVVFLDSISPTFYTGPGVTWSVSGGDDLSLQTYAMKGGVSFGTFGGVMNRWFGPSELNPDQQSAVEFYRWFPRDGPHWENGVSVYIPDSEAISAMSATMFYYAP